MPYKILITCTKKFAYSGGELLTIGKKYEYIPHLKSFVDNHNMLLYNMDKYFGKKELRKLKLNGISKQL